MFKYESTTSTTDETSHQQSQTFTTKTEKTLEPYTAANWSIILSKTKTTLSYTATIVPKVSTQFQGFLRYSGGKEKITHNFHVEHYNSDARPTVNYKFGDKTTPFYSALKQQSRGNSKPWLWMDLMTDHPAVKQLIYALCQESRYAFKITGRFEEIMGTHSGFFWKEVPVVDEVFEKNSEDAEPPHENIVVKNEKKNDAENLLPAN